MLPNDLDKNDGEEKVEPNYLQAGVQVILSDFQILCDLFGCYNINDSHCHTSILLKL